jgi:hypothetical protein
MSFDHFASLLRTEQLLFRKVSDFSDPFEGSVPKAYAELRRKSYEQSDEFPEGFATAISTVNKKIRDSIYANCWHQNQRESEAMWDSYGEKGVAIVTDTDSMINALQIVDDSILLRDVKYLDYYKSFESMSAAEQNAMIQFANKAESGLVSSVSMKRKSFEHENEIRLLYPEIDFLSEEEYESVDVNIINDEIKAKLSIVVNWEDEWKYFDFRQLPKGTIRKICVDLDRLINKIVIAPNADRWFKKTVRELVDNMGPDSITSERIRLSNTDLNEQEF